MNAERALVVKLSTIRTKASGVFFPAIAYLELFLDSRLKRLVEITRIKLAA